MDRIVEQKFVEKVLQHQGNRLLKNQGRALYVKARFRSGRLEKARSVSVSGGDDLSGELVFRHMDIKFIIGLFMGISWRSLNS